MKRKELKNIAKRIAECELIIQQNKDEASVEQAKLEILKLSNKITIFDLDLLDELVMENLIK